MSKVTALEPKRSTLRVFLDGSLALTLRAEVAAQQSLYVGQELSGSEVNDLERTNRLCNCLVSAGKYLAYRPHSEQEMRSKLARRYGIEAADQAVARLKDQGLVDDASFSEYWSRNRYASNPRSQRLVSLELRRKGVRTDVIKGLVNPDEDESAYRAAQGRIRHLTDDERSRRRLADYLRRRGFSYEVIARTIARIMKEQAGSACENVTDSLIRG